MHRRTSGSDDEEMKNPPKKVAEELGLHLVWEGPNVNESAPSAMAQRPWIVPEFKLVSNVYIL